MTRADAFSPPRAPASAIDRRILAIAALGAFYLRQGFPEKATPLLRAAERLLDDDAPAPDDALFAPEADDPLVELQDAVARNLAYALLLSGDGDGALEALGRARLGPRGPADAVAEAHIERRARRLSASRR